MKKNLHIAISWIILALMLIAMLPQAIKRVENEEKNQNVTVSVVYHTLASTVSPSKLNETLDKYLKIGVNSVTLYETDINFLMRQGLISSSRYNLLSLEYEEFSQKVAKKIKKTYPDVAPDSTVLLIEDKDTKAHVKYHMSRKYTDKDYLLIEDIDGTDVYVIHNSRANMWDLVLGYDEKIIKDLQKRGFEISLTHKMTNYKNTKYIEDIENIVKKYNIKSINLAPPGIALLPDEKVVKANYEGMEKIINKYDMTYILSENPDQLGNQDFPGSDYVYEKVMGEDGSKKVVRSYISYDDSKVDDTYYKHKVSQYFNSTMDRNIRFIAVTQIDVMGLSYDVLADFTFKAVDEYVAKIKDAGFKVNEPHVAMDYRDTKRTSSALGGVAMVMCMYIMYTILTKKKQTLAAYVAYVLAIGAALAAFILPEALVNLYPTAYSVIMSSFAVTLVLGFVKLKKDSLSFLALFALAILIGVVSMVILSLGMCTMLSGMNYYANVEIFRGIKLSLTVPIVYTAIATYYMFIKSSDFDLPALTKKVVFSEIKVYWLIIGAVLLAIVSYYLKRSGNVNTISDFERIMRETVTELFPARPRTKEFVVGYPALMLFVYYVKNYNLKLFNWCFAVGASILFASIANSYCHVFTNYFTICMRVVNGLVVGLVICIAVFIANLAAIKVVKKVKEKF